MKLWRCYNCPGGGGTPGLDFEADRPVCPGCGADPRKDPRHARFLVAREVIHFDPPSEFAGMGRNHRACDPAKPIGGEGYRATGEPAVVNCPACRATAAWREAAEARGLDLYVPPEADVEVAVPGTTG